MQHKIKLIIVLIIVLVALDTQAQNHNTASGEKGRIGLVLEGGGALGFAHVGVLKVLEENRVPVDLVTGTSIGSIVGAAYAAGVPLAEMEKIIGETNWDTLFDESAPRQDMPYRFKPGRRREIYSGTRFGLGEDGLVLPTGVTSGQKVLPLLQRMYGRVPSPIDFDLLPLPFRAVAADIETGESYVATKGDLATVVRASMSVPGFFSPVECDGLWLVDGGIVNNLPIDIAQSMGAERIIAVEFASNFAKRDKLTSPLAISGQVLDMLLEQNSKLQYKNLRPGDLLLRPDVHGYGAGDFNKALELMAIGETAARALVSEIKAYSVSEADYARFRARRERAVEPPSEVTSVLVKSDTNLTDEYIIKQVGVEVGKPFDRVAIEEGVQRLFNLGRFESVTYQTVEKSDGAKEVIINARKKSWYDRYFRIGASIEDDFEGDSRYRLGVNYRNVDIGDWGAYSDIEFEIGSNPRFSTEYYQPLGKTSPYFIAPAFSIQRTSLEPTVDDDRVAEYHRKLLLGGLALGRELGQSGELRLGYTRGSGSLDRYVGDPELPERDYDIGEFSAAVDFDALDTPDFPTSGYSAQLRYLSSMEDVGASDTFEALSGSFLKPITFNGRTTFALGSNFGVDFTQRPTERSLGFGGFLDISGFARNSLVASEFLIGKALLYHRFSEIKTPLFGFNFFTGASFEYAYLESDISIIDDTDGLAAGSVFFGADTPIWPIYLGLGMAEEGNMAVYLEIGRIGVPYR